VNKKVNTLLFLIGATVVNIVIMAAVMVGGLFLMGRLLPERIQESAGRLLFILLFLVAVGVAFFIYNRIIKILSKRVDMDKYFHPLFRPRRGS
jgi:hypothetical protein